MTALPTSQYSDHELWGKMKNGSQKAFTQLLKLYYNDLYFYGKRIAGSIVVAEDCIQEVFVDIWEKRESVSDVRRVKPYLMKAVRLRIIRRLSSRRHLVGEEAAPEQTAITFSIEDEIIRQQSTQEQSEQLHQALIQLSKRQKEVIYLKFFQGLSHEEIAAVMGLNKQSVKNLLHEALKKLRNILLSILLIILAMLFQ
ncbi:sigma-70 family RNA polymerase sigma factor [Rapidithrix thailandica]|uniref:Sigma-70 family RNA polymerase sigma factor n=1 Tax=Rapidithrix thailandica TaxID=413964 RepID=A0AAW9S0P0_9BACT